ncbi:Two-component transcriptional response regulator, LuxR family [hydrothermal vent metagenome]|uniref:Two-component transcriptional response regulator, LuxR family n=1 Tax=hydrothermal vent metagenome TaxID=652676 RepID=A0A3B0ZCN8_9ZZZZ
MNEAEIVAVIDDDAAVRDSLAWLLKSAGWKVKLYCSAEEYLDSGEVGWCGCLVLDVRMPGISGLELQQQLVAGKNDRPIIILTGHADVAMAVKALQTGAFDFLEKPFDDQVLLERVQQALQHNKEAQNDQIMYRHAEQRMALLTPREREVLGLICIGHSNKMMAEELNISCRTIEIHRGRVMEKMQAESLSSLVRLGVLTQLY